MSFDLFGSTPFSIRDGYKIADSDETDDNNTYFGIYTYGVGFFIMNIIATGKIKTYKYYIGDNSDSYADAWTNRATLTYGYYRL